jgi:hypothetical protein
MMGGVFVPSDRAGWTSIMSLGRPSGKCVCAFVPGHTRDILRNGGGSVPELQKETILMSIGAHPRKPRKFYISRCSGN